MRKLSVLLLLLLYSRAWAHHAFAATYFPDKTTTIEGKVVEFLFREPHSFVFVEAPDEKGRMINWVAEWSGGGQLSRQGIEKDALRAGDHVIVGGNPSRSPTDHRLRLRSITRISDGWKWPAQ